MGNFYTQILVCGSTQENCAEVMKDIGRQSIIVRPHRGIVPVCDRKSESQDIDELDSVAYTLSNRLEVPTVAWLNHDDDLLLVRIFGPEGFQGYCKSNMLAGGAYTKLKDACSAPCNALALWFAFARPHLFQVNRHKRLVHLMDLPNWSVGLGYNYLSSGEFEYLIPETEVIRT